MTSAFPNLVNLTIVRYHVRHFSFNPFLLSNYINDRCYMKLIPNSFETVPLLQFLLLIQNAKYLYV